MGTRNRKHDDANPERSQNSDRSYTFDQASLEERPRLISKTNQRLPRYYNPRTGRCDLTEEQADARERRLEVYNRACEEASDQRRRERLENWRNTPLEPAARLALGDSNPEVAWTELIGLIFGAIDESYPETLEIAKQMGLGIDFGVDMDLEDICLILSKLNPIEGVNQFNYVNPEVNLSDVARKIKPIEALTGVLRILATSDRPIPRNQWRIYH